MNSPDPDSPVSTDTESPPDEMLLDAHAGASPNFMNIASHITQSLSGGSKRRHPTGATIGTSSSNRDPKTRRRVELSKGGPSTGNAGPGSGVWDSAKEAKREERDLVDHHIVELLRKEVGDPFQDSSISKLA